MIYIILIICRRRSRGAGRCGGHVNPPRPAAGALRHQAAAALVTTSVPTGWRLPATLERLKREQDFVLLDTAPQDDTDAKLAMRGADLVLVPLQPSAADLWSMDATLDLAKQERRPFRLLLNRAPASGKLREDIEGQIRDRKLPMLDVVLGNRTAYAQAFMAGLGVVEASPRGPAAAEARALAAALEAIRKKGV